ncbi:MAG TPA: 1,2-phenylacetyl-CoA epoxidase subunit PaaD [Steroidobacteraceae bacterium]|nr:1,2-phenylacetyl-CoA epoxidase subunit PaaD [Steroidobacteraceae bacterium]
MRSASAEGESEIWRVLARVSDPELPILSIVELGIVRYVHWRDTEPPHVGITPTYSGCPATDVIRAAVRASLACAGYGDAIIEEVLAPPWTSDWLTAEGRRKLADSGIAPPVRSAQAHGGVACPRCASRATQLVSEFGSTPCKAHYRCTACLEPFEHFKCL